jgi:uncharacterized FlaG/YvyC family protein
MKMKQKIARRKIKKSVPKLVEKIKSIQTKINFHKSSNSSATAPKTCCEF